MSFRKAKKMKQNNVQVMQKDNFYQMEFFPLNNDASDFHPDKVWERIELRPGLWMSIMEVHPDRTVNIRYQKDPAMIDFGFILSGNINHRAESLKDFLKASGGFAGIGYFPGKKGVAKFSGKSIFRTLHLHIKPELLYEMVLDDMDTMPPDFRNIVEGNTGRTFLSRRSMGSITRMAVSEIFNPALSGFPKKLFLEYKAMELLTLQISHLMSPQKGDWNGSLSTNERSRIMEARDMLLKDLSDPPSLNDLSRGFSLSRNKLQFGFRVMFGNSVFGYLREHKMQKACYLFKSTDMTVSQVAWETGYVNVSQFTKAFKKRFGVLPKQFRL